jgi:DNA/RNA-binding domain of Phe-tRNA-synthetase-like protein
MPSVDAGDGLEVAPELAAIVRPAWIAVERVSVVDRDARLDDPLKLAARFLRVAAQAADATAAVTVAVRTMYKRVGIDPTKTRPSSESLLRRVVRGDELPRVNSLVDVINWCSAESHLPFGLYDLDRIRGRVTLRLGRPGEEYAGIRKDVVHVEGRMTLADLEGPFGNPTSDSARTMVTTSTTRALVVIFAPTPVAAAAVDGVVSTLRERIDRYCAAPA